MIISSSFWIIWGFKVGFWDWGIFLILVGILIGSVGIRNIDNAIKFKDALESKDPYALLDRAYESFKWDDDDDGNKLLLEALKYDPNEVKFYTQMGFLYDNLGQKELSNHYFKKADELDPPDELYYEEGKLKRRKKT